MNPSQQRRDPNAIVPRGSHRLTAGDYFRRFMEETMREMDRAFSIGPYWESQPNLHECNIGNSVGSQRRDPNAIVPRGSHRLTAGDYFRRFMEETMREMDRAFSIGPYWESQPNLHECNIGNSVGSVVDNAEKFQVEVDVAQFRPNELSVNVRDHELIIEGHHQERSDQVGSIERHFVRKYSLPQDVQASAFESRLSDSGLLTVFAPKSNAPAGRSIPIQAASARSNSRRARQ
uniref:SHSP domain-containing protein n=1 Tax=Ascaris lumbricoides TaxID=6252 RepID=A0A9J2PWZ3_ASCLU